MREVLGEIVGHAVGELHLVDRAVRAALAAGAVVGDDDDHRVLELLVRLEVVEQPPDVVVGVSEEARVHLRHAREEPLLLVVQRVPRPRDVELGNGLPSGPGARLGRADRVERRQLACRPGTMPSFFWFASVCSRIAS